MIYMQKDILLCPNPGRDIGLEITRQVFDILKKHGRNAVICPLYDEGEPAVASEWAAISELTDALPNAEAAVTFGGDGTILRVARASAGLNVPILGVNMGGKGFMAELEPDELGLIEKVAAGNYDVENRMMLDIELVRDGVTVFSDFALNDVVVSGVNKVIDLTLFGDGKRISGFTGDGTVIATPTGSTAYSMSAGGPIVEPTAHSIIVTPICAHVLEAKPFVLAPNRFVSVEIGQRKSNPAFLSSDGGEVVPVYAGDVVNVRRSEKLTLFVQLLNRSFYKKVSEKLGEKI